MPHRLTYDTLPPHSTLRREIEDGVLKITAASEEPSAAVRRHALIATAIPAAILSFALLLVLIGVFGGVYLANRRNLDSTHSIILLIAFVVLCASLFGFVWRSQFNARLDALNHALQQATILAAAPGRLLVETAGPFGKASREFASPKFRVPRAARLSSLEIRGPDGETLHLLRGRSETELKWVMRAIDSAMSRA